MNEQQIYAHAEAREEHAHLIIEFLERITSGNLQECLDVTRQEFDTTRAELWRRARDILLRRIAIQRRTQESQPASQGLDDELPF